MPGVIPDAGGLIALDRDDHRVVVLLARARETAARFPGIFFHSSGRPIVVDSTIN
jgi:hypothetical protein